MSELSKFRTVMDIYLKSIPSHVDDHAKGNLPTEMPIIPGELVKRICWKACEIFREEPNILSLQSPIVIIGDLHGHVLDLYRILLGFGMPDRRSYLFLGDVVDRGEFSIETVLIIFLLKVLYPTSVYIIRGNHEFESLCGENGFKSQVLNVYGDVSVYTAFTNTFSFIPLVATIDKTVLCVHGGIGPDFQLLRQVEDAFTRPITEFGDDDLLNCILWSDPSTEATDFSPSPRGIGYHYGANAVKKFCTAQNLKMIVRAHECVSLGYQSMFDGRLATVFSASNYCGSTGNKAAVLVINGSKVEPVRLPPLAYLLRDKVSFTHPFTPAVKSQLQMHKRGSCASVTKPSSVLPSRLPRMRAESPTKKRSPPLPAKKPVVPVYRHYAGIRQLDRPVPRPRVF